MKEKFSEILRFRADADLFGRVKKVAKKRHTKPSQVLRDAVVEYLAKQEAA
jgi:predicted transcriptional regulator